MNHTEARELLTPLADGALPVDVRGRVEGHVAGCVECTLEVADLRRLNLALASFPPAPQVAFAPFWHRLRASLPAPKAARRPFFPLTRRAALAFAIAALGALMVGGTAFASESALPDSPLYSVKRVGENVLLTFVFDPNARVDLEIQLAGERLREAQAMAADHKAQLATASVRDFNALLRLTGAALRQPGADKTVKMLQAQLDSVRQTNAENEANDDLQAELVEGKNTLDEDQEAEQGTESDSESIVGDRGAENQTSSSGSVSNDSRAGERSDDRSHQRSDD